MSKKNITIFESHKTAIPYVFNAIPNEFMIDTFLEDPVMMKLIRYIFKRIRKETHEEIFECNRTHIKLILNPYEFVFGRKMCAKECGVSERQIRTRMNLLTTSSYVSSSTSSSTSSYSVHRLMTESFKQNNDQQFGQHNDQQFDHKDRYKEEKKDLSIYHEKVMNNEKVMNIEEISLQTSDNAKNVDSNFFKTSDNTSEVTVSDKIFFKTSDNIRSVVSFSIKETTENLLKEMFSQQEIAEAINIAQKNDPKIKPGCFLNYLKGIIENKRKEFKLKEVIKNDRRSKTNTKPKYVAPQTGDNTIRVSRKPFT